MKKLLMGVSPEQLVSPVIHIQDVQNVQLMNGTFTENVSHSLIEAKDQIIELQKKRIEELEKKVAELMA